MAKTESITFSEDELRQLADGMAFDRGRAYWQAGRVGTLRVDSAKVIATVSGETDYEVQLWREDGDLAWSCSCPIGETHAFCKHAVAVGWAVMAGACRGAVNAQATIGDIRVWLLAKDKTELAEMILAQAREDDRLLQRLTLGVAREHDAGLNLDVWRRALDDVIRHECYIEYAAVADYVARIEEVLDNLDELLGDGHAAAVIALADHAIDALVEAVKQVDDSNGRVGGLLWRLKALHLAACRKAPPDPEHLAQCLFDREMDTEGDVFVGGVTVYADLLGETGRARFAYLAAEEWAKVPVLVPGDSDTDRYGRRYRIRSIMLALAADVDDVVAVMARNLSTPWDFLEIARTCQRGERLDEALEWAERGWQAFRGQRPDERLRIFLAELWHQRQRHDEAMALVWEGFDVLPGFAAYRTLKTHADYCGQWPAWRNKALARMHERIGDIRRSSAIRSNFPWLELESRNSHSELVDIYLWEGDDDAAWQEAHNGGCSHQHWLRLAEYHASRHPEEALAVFYNELPVVLPATGSGDYERAIGFVRHIRDLLSRLGRAEEFDDFVAELRSKHRRKRNFIKLLNGEGW